MYLGIVKEKYENYNMYDSYEENLKNSEYKEYEIKALDYLVVNAYNFDKTTDFLKTVNEDEQIIKVIEDLEKSNNIKFFHYSGLLVTFAFFVGIVLAIFPLIDFLINKIKEILIGRL